MVNQRMLVLLTALGVVTIGAACQPLPVPTTQVEFTRVPKNIASFPEIAATPTSTVVMTGTAVPAAAEEEDCMGECHLPDSNTSFADGAMPQPTTHIGRTTCLSCHSTLTKPLLPGTHVGRLDPSCALCHTEGSAAE